MRVAVSVLLLLFAARASGQIQTIQPGDSGSVSRVKINSNFQYLDNRISSLVVSVRDFGATGNGTADDTAAFQAAFAHIKSRVQSGVGHGYRGAAPALYIPAGVYRITVPGVLCGSPDVSTAFHGYRVYGDGHRASVLKLEFANTSDNYLCRMDNTVTYASFEDFSLYGVNGWEKGFFLTGQSGQTLSTFTSWKNMEFRNLMHSITITSADNWRSDEMYVEKCQFWPSSVSGGTAYWVYNASNSVTHTFNHVLIYLQASNLTGVRFESGGQFEWFGGSLIVTGPITDSVGIRIEDDPNSLPNPIAYTDNTFAVYDVKPEVSPGNLLYYMKAMAILHFYNMNAATGYTNTAVRGKIDRYGHVYFHGGKNFWRHELITQSTESFWNQWFRAKLVYENVGVNDPENDIIITHTGSRIASRGKFECRGCFYAVEGTTINWAQTADVCKNCDRGYGTEPRARRQAVFRYRSFVGEGLPQSSDGNLGFSLPKNIVLRAITLVKQNGGTATSGRITVRAPTGEVLLVTPEMTETTELTVTAAPLAYATGDSNTNFTISSTSGAPMYGYVIFEW